MEFDSNAFPFRSLILRLKHIFEYQTNLNRNEIIDQKVGWWNSIPVLSEYQGCQLDQVHPCLSTNCSIEMPRVEPGRSVEVIIPV